MRMVPTWGTEAARGAPSHGRGAVAARSTASSEPCPYSGASGGCSTRHRRSGSADGAERRSGQTPTSATPAAPRTSPATVSSERAGRSNDLYRSLEQRYPWPLSASCGLSAGAVRSSSTGAVATGPVLAAPSVDEGVENETFAPGVATSRSSLSGPTRTPRCSCRSSSRCWRPSSAAMTATAWSRWSGSLWSPSTPTATMASRDSRRRCCPVVERRSQARRRAAPVGDVGGAPARRAGTVPRRGRRYPPRVVRRTLNRSSARRRTAGAPGNSRTCRNHAQI